MATILALTQKLPRLLARREWRAKRATPCQADPRGNFCVGARIVVTAAAWVHRGSVQLANTTIHTLLPGNVGVVDSSQKPASCIALELDVRGYVFVDLLPFHMGHKLASSVFRKYQLKSEAASYFEAVF